MLSDEHTHKIQAEIDKSRITIQSLKEDLLDHFCCFVEEEMKWGSSFHEAYLKATKQICPNGFDEIQKETIFLLNSKKIMTMKKALYFIGLGSAMSMSLGFLFRILHMPGADQLTYYGLFVFALLFLPMLAIFQYKNTFSKIISERLKAIFGICSAILIAVGVLLKMQALSSVGNILLIVGILLFTFGYLPSLFFRMYKKSLG